MTVLFQTLYTNRGQPYRIDVIEHYTGGKCWTLYRIKKPSRYHSQVTLSDIVMAEKVPAFTRAECARFPKQAGLFANSVLGYYLACEQEGVPAHDQLPLL